MRLKKITIATLLAISASSAYAGSFVQLTDGNGTTLTSANGGIKSGAQNSNSDIFNLLVTSATYVNGYSNLNVDGDVVASTINYSTYSGNPSVAANITGGGTLNLLDWQVSRGVDLSPGSQQADVFDYVYQDSVSGNLVFATRYLNRVDNNEEANYLYRYNFSTTANYKPQVAWLFSTDNDLRMYQAALTNSTSLGLSAPYSSNVVRQKGDFSLSEGNPWSGLFLVKSDAKAYTIKNGTIGFFQAGEEGQPKVGGTIAGYAATTLSSGVSSNETTYVYGGTYGTSGSTTSVAGTMNVKTGNATFNGDVAVTNGGAINTAVGATTTFNGEFNQQVGALLGGGGTFVFNGGYSAGNSPGAVTVNGDVVFGATNTSLFEIAGITLGSEYDHVTVNGNLTFGGVLDVVFLSGFTATAGQTFNLFDFTSATGTFSALNLATLGTGLVWNTANLYTDGSISVMSTVVPTTPVPEPENYALMMLGLGVIASIVNRKKKQS